MKDKEIAVATNPNNPLMYGFSQLGLSVFITLFVFHTHIYILIYCITGLHYYF